MLDYSMWLGSPNATKVLGSFPAMFMLRHQPTIRFNMKPRQPKPVMPWLWSVLAALLSILLAWEIFRWIAL